VANNSGFNEAPIFWTTTQAGYNDRDRTRRYMKDGKRVVEKVPQSGHVGDYNNRSRAQGLRYVKMINSAGNEFSMVLTNGAAHMDPNTAYGQYVRRKARFLAWYGVGECPCALIATGEINAEGFMSESARTGSPCAKGSFKGDGLDTMCPHAKAERKARMDHHAADQAERGEKMKGKEDKIIELLTAAAIKNGIDTDNAPEPKARRTKKDEE
jgi:hypothetical protein